MRSPRSGFGSPEASPDRSLPGRSVAIAPFAMLALLAFRRFVVARTRTLTTGDVDLVQFYVDLPGHFTFRQAHTIIERVERDLPAEFPDAEVLIHIAPAGHVDEPRNRLVEKDQFDILGDHAMFADQSETNA